MLRISEIRQDEQGSLFKLEGKLIEPWVNALREQLTARVSPVREVDLAGLTFADAAGVELLRELRVGGVEIAACSPFILELLNCREESPS